MRFKSFIEAKAGDCPDGQYYCQRTLTCKPIPKGMKKNADGFLVKEDLKEKDTHVTKDGRTVKKGLWYYMNKRKKAGTSRPGTGTVSQDAIDRSSK